MRRGVVALGVVVAALLCVGTSPVQGADTYPVSVGFSFGRWTPSMDAYNLRYIEENNPTVLTIGGRQVTVRIREPLDYLDSTITFYSGTPSEFTTGRIRYLYGTSSGYGAYARIRLHSEVFALLEYDWWSQEVGSLRNFGGMIGYEAQKVTLNPVTGSLVYELPTEGTGKWWPTLYVGGGAGAVLVERTSIQVTNAAPPGGAKATSSGTGTIFTGLAGMDFTPPILGQRVSFFVHGRYILGDYNEQFPLFDTMGNSLTDSLGRDRTIEKAVSVQGPQVKMGVSLSFGQIRNRPTKGVLTGLLESRARRGGYAMAPSYGPMTSGGGVAVIYPQPSEQVQVVQGTGGIDEDRIRQIIREELMSARVTTGQVRQVDDLAEQQLRSIRQRRLQAEQELEQLKELLREEG